MSSAPPTSHIDDRLHDLLVREGHLRLSREQLKPVLDQEEEDLRAVQAARPTFLGIMPKAKREAYRTQLTSAEETVRILRKGWDVIERCEPHIAKMIEEAVENVLRKDSPEYVQALAAHQQKEDWHRCLERFGQKIFEFTRALGNVRNLACSGYVRHTRAYSQNALQAFVLAIQAAEQVEEEVKFANKISRVQVALLAENGFTSRSLPWLSEPKYAVWVSKISSMPLAEAQLEFDVLIAETKQLYESVLPELRAQATQVEATQEAEIRNFLVAAWDQFRDEITPEIFPGDTEQNVAETERMLVTAAKSSVLGRLEGETS